MIRTSVSFCILLGGLFFATRLLEQSSAEEQRQGKSQASPRVAQADLEGRLRRNSARLAERLRRGLPDAPAAVETRTAIQPQSSPAAQPALNPSLADSSASSRRQRPAQEPQTQTPERFPIAVDAARLTDQVAPQPATERSDSQLSADQQRLRAEIRRSLAYYFERPENVAERSPWGVMHALIAYGVDTELIAGGKKVNAIGWLCWNGPCRGQQLLYLRGDNILARQGPGYEGHRGQFLAMLAQSRVAEEYVMKVDGRELTIRDLVRSEQRTCRSGEELTFKLIGLSHYLESDATWQNEQGQTWGIPDLIREELAQSVIGAACGGTHRMMGFSFAVRKREQRGEPVDGQWLRAKKYVDEYHEYTFRLQNPDGSFSTNWFDGRGSDTSLARRIQTTGHILEWLVYSLPEDQLQDPRIVKSVEYLNGLLWNHRNQSWEIGPKGHALHALALYDERVFGGRPGQRAEQLLAADANRRSAQAESSR